MFNKKLFSRQKKKRVSFCSSFCQKETPILRVVYFKVIWELIRIKNKRQFNYIETSQVHSHQNRKKRSVEKKFDREEDFYVFVYVKLKIFFDFLKKEFVVKFLILLYIVYFVNIS